MEGTSNHGKVEVVNGRIVHSGKEEQNILTEEEISLMEKEGKIIFLDNEREYRDRASVLNGKITLQHLPRSGKCEFFLTRGYDMLNRLEVEGENIRGITFSTEKEKLFSFPVVQTCNPFVVTLPFAFPCFLAKFTEVRVSFDADSVSSVKQLGNFYENMDQTREMRIHHKTCEGNGILFDGGIVVLA